MKTIRIHTSGYIHALKTNGPIFSKMSVSDFVYERLVKDGVVVELVNEIQKPDKVLPVHKEEVDMAIVPKNPLLSEEEINELVKKEELEVESEVVEEVEETKEEVVEPEKPEEQLQPTKLAPERVIPKSSKNRKKR